MAEPGDQRRSPRRTFGPVVLLGVASAALAAWAASKPWVSGTGADSFAEASVSLATTAAGEIASSPLGTALAFVVLACWGVVLVTRGRFRRAVAALAVLAALGYAATVVWAPFSLPDHLVEQVRRRTGATLDETSLTGWFWLAAVAALLVLASTVLALRLVRTWPEMGTRYDAPTGARAAGAGDGAGASSERPTDNIDIWKALDEGRDPTA
ncbi:Trp biosynthesis-associated membrane protein [Nocardioides pinisoli]|uniref:Trp biosynthesis-associated membrane protein n=1 Tax=Nocardioides pinisoli TaxID=2950279 RepID=A0ABT1L4L5_9ACTN|nr:Trp biosynthesis-associated membrane protein [Nocardioides pinisoli]MCP3423996.1 Trp biosynthesis-associated membrane protein [Nocardioides pinisoli]